MCECSSCDKRSPHPIYNCVNECEKTEQVNNNSIIIN